MGKAKFGKRIFISFKPGYNCFIHKVPKKYKHLAHQSGKPDELVSSHHWEMDDLNEFYTFMEIFDILMIGRGFTWCRNSDSTKNRMDRFFFLKEWLKFWSNFSQFILDLETQGWGLGPKTVQGDKWKVRTPNFVRATKKSLNNFHKYLSSSQFIN